MSILRPRYLGVASLFLLLAFFVACSGKSAVPPIENSSNSFGISNTPPEFGESIAPSFTVSTGGGSTFSLDEHDDEVVILYFSFPG